MQADALSPRDLFDGKVHYEIPSFQRPYVWTEEDQWAPLWADIQRVALKLLAASSGPQGPQGQQHRPSHFLGAVVVKTTMADAGDVTRHSVIDGQQRMTTLQLLLNAVRRVIEDLNYDEEAEALGELIRNESRRFATKRERFKLWPCRADRQAFEAAMEQPAGQPAPVSLVSEAHSFFHDAALAWVTEEPEGGDIATTEAARVAVLAKVLQSHLYLVSINLGPDDDDQVIFETLNDRGTPLLAADLIKNWIFQKGESYRADTNSWAEKLWLEFDDDWWRQTISQGRHLRSRIDIFMQYWLTMRTRDEVPTEWVFRSFRDYASDHMVDLATSESFLEELKVDAATFRGFAELDTDSAGGRFYTRVIENLELAATTPILLWMLSKNHHVAEEQIELGLMSLESWVIRRTLLRYTMKDVNRLMVALLGDLDENSTETAGKTVHEFLASQTADSRLWPTDDNVVHNLPNVKLYGNVRQGRLRVVLEGIEMYMRTQRHEAIVLPTGLEIEHIMPQGWRAHWNSAPPLNEDDATERDRRVNTIGNLTLTTKKLNGTLSHRPWTDDAASIVTQGTDPAKGKRTLLSDYSLLALNQEIVGQHPDSWTDKDIEKRGKSMAARLCAVWVR